MPPKSSTVRKEILRGGGYSDKGYSASIKGIKALEELQKKQGAGAVATKALANEHLKLTTNLGKGVLGVATLSEAFKEFEIQARGRVHTVVPAYAKLAEVMAPKVDSGIMEAVKFIAPALSEAMLGAKALSAGLVGFLAVVLLVQAVVQGFKMALQDSFAAMKSLSGGLGWLNVRIKDSVGFAQQAATASFVYGLKLNEILDLTKSLTDASAMNAFQMTRMGDNWGAVLAHSAGEFLALAKVTGLTNDKAAALATTFIMMGNNAITNLSDSFKTFQRDVQATGLNVGGLTQVFDALAPVSMTVKSPMSSMVTVLVALKQRFIDSKDEMLTFIKTAGRTKLVTDSLMSFGQAAANLKLPELMAFGGGMEPGVNPWEALKSGIGQSREQTLLNYMQKIADSTGGGLDEKKFQVAMALQQQGVPTQLIAVLAELIGNSTKQQLNKEGADAQRTIAAQEDNMKATAILASTMEDPLERVAKGIESLILIVVGGINALFPGAGSALQSQVSGGKPSSKGEFAAASPEGG